MKLVYNSHNKFKFNEWLISYIGRFLKLITSIFEIATFGLIYFEFEIDYILWSLKYKTKKDE